DAEFLKLVFASTRADELAVLTANPEQAGLFLEMQFKIQRENYRAAYPAAENSIILFQGEPIGRIMVDCASDVFFLVDIAILNDYRDRGIGSILIRRLMKDAANLHKCVRLSVYKSNPALRLYERLGFTTVSETGAYFEMKWCPDK